MGNIVLLDDLTINKIAATNSVAISGTNTWGSTLTATITTNSDGTKGYKWYYSTTAGATSGGTAVGDTNCNTGSTCVIPSSLVGKYIYVVGSVAASTTYAAATDSTDATDASTNTTQAVAKKASTPPTLSAVTVTYDSNRHYIGSSGGTDGLTAEYAYCTWDGSSCGSWSGWGTAASYYSSVNPGAWKIKARLQYINLQRSYNIPHDFQDIKLRRIDGRRPQS